MRQRSAGSHLGSSHPPAAVPRTAWGHRQVAGRQLGAAPGEGAAACTAGPGAGGGQGVWHRAEGMSGTLCDRRLSQLQHSIPSSTYLTTKVMFDCVRQHERHAPCQPIAAGAKPNSAARQQTARQQPGSLAAGSPAAPSPAPVPGSCPHPGGPGRAGCGAAPPHGTRCAPP